MAAELRALEQTITAAAVMLPRIGAVFIVLPIFEPSLLNGVVRAGLAGLLALFLAPLAGDLPALPLGMLLAVVLKEAFIGALLGLAFGIFIWAIESVGDLIDFQTGAGNAAFFEPVAGHQNGPTGEFLRQLAITLFVSAGGLLALVGALIDSFRLWPVHAFFPNLGRVLAEFAIRQGDTLFTWIVKLAAPVLLVLLLVDVGMGLVGRAAPQLNVFTSAQPVKSLLAVLMLVLFLFFLFDSLQQFLQPANGALRFLRDTL